MPYQFRGDIAHADIAFDAWGESLEEVFSASADATLQVMVEDLSGVHAVESVQVHLEQADPEMLLFDFLNELIFYKDARRLLLRPAQLRISESGGRWSVETTLRGEEICAGRHQLNTDVKAVTMHRFSLRRDADRWAATVVLDV